MQSQSSYTQLTVYYLNGQSESFMVYDPVDAERVQQEFQQVVRRLLDRPWWIFHLSDQTVCIHIANVMKVEVKPPLPRLHGEDVFENTERVTALNRTAHRE